MKRKRSNWTSCNSDIQDGDSCNYYHHHHTGDGGSVVPNQFMVLRHVSSTRSSNPIVVGIIRFAALVLGLFSIVCTTSSITTQSSIIVTSAFTPSSTGNTNNSNNRSTSVPTARKQFETAIAATASSSKHNSGDNTNSNTMTQIRHRMNELVQQMKSSSSSDDYDDLNKNDIGKLEELKQREAELSALLAEVRREKLSVLRSRPLTIGIIGYGRFGQFIAKTFTKYGNVIVTSRSDYTDIANQMGCTYVPMDDIPRFLQHDLDVIVVATSIVSFESTIKMLAPFLRDYITQQQQKQSTVSSTSLSPPESCRGPLVVDVLSVKEHARQIMIEHLPIECDILCTHPMFGPDSGKNGWYNLNFVYEKTRIDTVLIQQNTAYTNGGSARNGNSDSSQYASLPIDSSSTSSPSSKRPRLFGGFEGTEPAFVAAGRGGGSSSSNPSSTTIRSSPANETFVDNTGKVHSVHEGSDAHIEGMDRMERFLSIWEEEGCRMVQMSCADHDMYAANSQFITHLIGRVLSNQGLESTPIDTAGFQSVLKLIQNTVSDSFDLFYGLYKYNRKNSYETIQQLQAAMNDVVTTLQQQELKQQQDGKE